MVNFDNGRFVLGNAIPLSEERPRTLSDTEMKGGLESKDAASIRPLGQATKEHAKRLQSC